MVAVGLVLATLFVATAAVAQEPRGALSIDQLMDTLRAVRGFREVAVSPDGHSVAWLESLRGKNRKSSARTAIYVADLNSPAAAPRRLTTDDGSRSYSEHGIACQGYSAGYKSQMIWGVTRRPHSLQRSHRTAVR